jgi:hypothetical protein
MSASELASFVAHVLRDRVLHELLEDHDENQSVIQVLRGTVDRLNHSLRRLRAIAGLDEGPHYLFDIQTCNNIDQSWSLDLEPDNQPPEIYENLSASTLFKSFEGSDHPQMTVEEFLVAELSINANHGMPFCEWTVRNYGIRPEALHLEIQWVDTDNEIVIVCTVIVLPGYRPGCYGTEWPTNDFFGALPPNVTVAQALEPVGGRIITLDEGFLIRQNFLDSRHCQFPGNV